MHPVLPYVPSPEEKVEKIIEWAQVQPGQKSVDLGAGDGRIVIALARAGARAYGFEILQKYARRAKANIAREGLGETAHVILGDFWKEDLSSYDIVTIYGMAAIMERVSEKLTRELRPGAIVISNGFPLPNWKHQKEESHLYFYIKK